MLALAAAALLFGAAVAHAAPANDNFTDAETLTGLPTSTTGSNVDATTEVDEPDHNNFPGEGHSVWYEWVAPSSGPVTVDLSGSGYDTYLAVYTGASLDLLSLVGKNDSGGVGSTSKLGFAATIGETYWIAVDGYIDATGSIELSIFVPGSISGTVTDESPVPVDDVCTSAHDASGDAVGFGFTDSAGDYEIDNLAAGNYRIMFQSCVTTSNYLTEFYDDQPDLDSAQQVAVTSGSETTGIDAEMVAAGSIQGTVTDSGTNPLESFCVVAYDSGGSYKTVAYTNASGEYSIRNLDTGEYRLEFYNCGSPANVLPEYYNDKGDLESADPVSVVRGVDTTGINAELAIGGSISGNVTYESAGPLEDICVTAYYESGGFVNQVRTDAAGDYTITGLRTDSYLVEFQDCGDNNVISEYYDNQPLGYLADPIAVAEGVDTSGIDAELAEGGRMSGTVTNALGAPLEDICVGTSSGAAEQGGNAQTNSAGEYLIGGLRAAGDYIVQFTDCGSNNVVAEFYDDVRLFGDASPVTVTQGAETSGVDAELATGGTVTGTVVDEQGDPLEGICVDAYDPNFGIFIFIGGGGGSFGLSDGQTDANGEYELTGGYTGKHVVYFYDCGGNNVIDEYYNNAYESRRANRVPVTEGANTPNIDVEMLSADSPPPDTVIDSGPSGTIRSNQATFTFRGSPGARTAKFKCRIDGGTYFDCGSPQTFTDLSDGSHTVDFRAIGYAGNSDSTPASRTFTVEYAPCEAAQSDLDKAKKKQKKAREQKNRAGKSLKKAKKSGSSSKVKKARKKLNKAKKKLKKAKRQVKSANRAVGSSCD